LTEMPFFYIGLFTLHLYFKKNALLNPMLIYALIALSIIPSALTFENPHALRTSSNIILYPIVTVTGVCFVCEWLKTKKRKQLLIGLFSSLFIVNFVFCAFTYCHSSTLSKVGQQVLLVEMAKKINHHQYNYRDIYIEDFGNQPYMYITHYCHIRPEDFKRMFKYNDGQGWDHLTRLDKFQFIDKDAVIAKMKNTSSSALYVLRYKVDGFPLLDSLRMNNNHLYFYKINRQKQSLSQSSSGIKSY
jgi:hypothetical protein